MGGEATLENCSKGPSGMRAEQLNRWMEEARKEEATAAEAEEGSGGAIGGPG